MWQPDISVTSEFPVIRLESPPCVEITSYNFDIASLACAVCTCALALA